MLEGSIEPHLLERVKNIPIAMKKMEEEIAELSLRNTKLLITSILLGAAAVIIIYQIKQDTDEIQSRG